MSPVLIASLASLAVFGMMLVEWRISMRNERRLRDAGAIEPAQDVYSTMQWVYPAAFVVMALEGAIFGSGSAVTTFAGAVLLTASKALKFWAIVSLGWRWTFRVLVVPGAPLVDHGPYAMLRHPNYVAVIGELVSMAVLVNAWVTGPLATVLFSVLLRSRISVENRALRHPACS
jgi:methyltransferase